MIAVRDVERVLVYSRSPDKREAFAAEVRAQHDIDARAVDTPQEAAGAQSVLAATNTGFNGPVALEGAWLAPDAHVNTIGATAPTLREADPQTFSRASAVVIDTEHAGPECGDIVAAEAAGTWPAARVVTLPEVAGQGGAWKRPEGISVFKSVGTAVQDLAAAHAIVVAARERGLGTDFDLLAPKTF
jgi:ornithine cyclodeaminase/alanine dehydrogenase-like protein (mu-crystallin family)